MSLASVLRSAIRAVPADMRSDVTFRHPGTQKTVSIGTAVQDEPDLEGYAAASIRPERAATVFFVPSANYPIPPIDSEVEWAGEKFGVKTRGPLAPGGTAVGVTLVLVR